MPNNEQAAISNPLGVRQKIASAATSSFLAIKGHPLISIIMAIAIIMVLYVLTMWLASPIPLHERAPSDYFEKIMDDSIKANIKDFAIWYRGNIVLQLSLIVTSLLATILSAITTKDNADRTKFPYRSDFCSDCNSSNISYSR
jgi:hypothetical protein